MVQTHSSEDHIDTMAGKKKSAKKSAKSGKKSGKKPGKKSGKKSGKSSAKSTKSVKSEVDILSTAAMDNLYYIAHDAVDALSMRGFGWPDAPKGKKGKKGKKKKK